MRAFKERAGRANESVLIWIVNLPLVIVTENEFLLPPVSRFPIDVRANQPAFRKKMIDGTRIENSIRISGVAYGVSKQTPDPQLFARRPADIGDHGRVAVIVVRARVLRVETTRANRIIEAIDLAVALPPFTKAVVRSTLRGHHGTWSSCALFGENLDNACERARPIQGALRPAHHLDPFDIVGSEVGKIKCALQPLIDRNAIEQNLCVFAAQSTSENRGQLASRSGLHNGQPGNFAKRVAYALDLFLLEILRANHADAGRRLIERNVESRRGNDDLLNLRFAR